MAILFAVKYLVLDQVPAFLDWIMYPVGDPTTSPERDGMATITNLQALFSVLTMERVPSLYGPGGPGPSLPPFPPGRPPSS